MTETRRLELHGQPVLVTGASGFVGSAVARALATQGARVRMLVRDGVRRWPVDVGDGEIVAGDARDPAAVAAAAQGMRFVFHVAADYRLWAPRPQDIVANNLAMTDAACAAALAAGVERFVYTSSVATLRSAVAGVADESATAAPDEAVGAYKRSKVLAEQRVLRAVEEDGLPAVIVLPSTPIGPGDVRPTPTGRIILEALAGRMPAYVDSGLNLVHVDDVAAGHVLALEHGEIGERYILGGADVSLKDMLAAIARLAGRRFMAVRLPRAPLVPLALLAEATARLTGREPFITRDALNMSRHRMYFSSAKAHGELGYSARPWEEGLRDAITWFRARGMA